jgi:hypothetical protein
MRLASLGSPDVVPEAQLELLHHQISGSSLESSELDPDRILHLAVAQDPPRLARLPSAGHP